MNYTVFTYMHAQVGSEGLKAMHVSIRLGLGS